LFDFFKKKAQVKEETPSYAPDPSRILCVCNFNDDLSGWVVRGPGWQQGQENAINLSLTSETKRSGASCLKVSGRYANWHGATLNIAKYVKESLMNYEVMVWVKLPDDAVSSKVYLSLETNSKLGGVVFPHYEQFQDFDPGRGVLSKYRLPVNGDHGDDYERWEVAYPKENLTSDGWVLLHGKVKINRSEHFRAYVYIETDEQGKNNDIYIDDFILLRGTPT
jgi:hypothetical protein